MSQDCIFCKIAAGEMGDPPLYQDEQVTAFHDINPQAPTHILIIPNKHIPSVDEAAPADQALLGQLLLTAQKIARQENLGHHRLVINTGSQAGQSVFHLHLHLLAGRAMKWPPG